MTNLSSLSFLANSIVQKRRLAKDSFDWFLEQKILSFLSESIKEANSGVDLGHFPKECPKFVC